MQPTTVLAVVQHHDVEGSQPADTDRPEEAGRKQGEQQEASQDDREADHPGWIAAGID